MSRIFLFVVEHGKKFYVLKFTKHLWKLLSRVTIGPLRSKNVL